MISTLTKVENTLVSALWDFTQEFTVQLYYCNNYTIEKIGDRISTSNVFSELTSKKGIWKKFIIFRYNRKNDDFQVNHNFQTRHPYFRQYMVAKSAEYHNTKKSKKFAVPGEIFCLR